MPTATIDHRMTTSDGSGMFAFSWTPDIVGAYTVDASFEGSESYYPSSAETSFHAAQAVSTTTAPAENQQSVADIYFIPAIIGLFVAIVIVESAIILVLRKLNRPNKNKFQSFSFFIHAYLGRFLVLRCFLD